MPPPSLPGSSGPISILALETRTDVLLALAIKRQSSSCLTLHPFGHVLNLGEFGLDWPTDRTKEDSYVVSVLGSYVRLKKKKGKDASEIAAKLDVLERALIAQKVRLRSTPSLPPHKRLTSSSLATVPRLLLLPRSGAVHQRTPDDRPISAFGTPDRPSVRRERVDDHARERVLQRR